MQQGMLFHCLSMEQEGVYIEQVVCRIPEAVDEERMQKAWQAVTSRHDVLRTRFKADAQGVFEQQVLESAVMPFATEHTPKTSVLFPFKSPTGRPLN